MATIPPEITERLDRSIVIWLTTVTADGLPQPSPVWFLHEEGRFIVYSLANAPRVRNLRANPRVALSLNSTDDGSDVLVIEGEARLEDGPPSVELPAYVAKYAQKVADYGWTAESFARDYPQRIVITPTRVRAY